jgi:hypothetical protein
VALVSCVRRGQRRGRLASEEVADADDLEEMGQTTVWMVELTRASAP